MVFHKPKIDIKNFHFPTKLAPLFKPHRYKVIFGGRGGAKCLAVGTKVIMADGTLRAVEAVRVGESVMGPDSAPRKVLAVTKGRGRLYRINQTSGISYTVNEDHIISLKKSNACKADIRLMPSGRARSPRGRYPDWSDITNIEVTAAAAQSARWLANFRGYRAGLVRFAERPVHIDPYFLGVWLGDGTSRELRVTSADSEIIEACYAVAKSFGGTISVNGKPENKAKDIGLLIKSGRVNPLWQHFKRYGLQNNKHIPQSYLANSERIRLQLLAGILDTDGHYRSHGYMITQVSTRLANQIKFLADGLGFRTHISGRKTFCTLRSGKRVEGFAWRISINGDVWRIPCRIARKRANKDDIRKNKDWLLSQISIEPAGVGKWAGFAVDGDHLFLLEDGTVTHNSWSVARALLIIGVQRRLRVLCARELMNSIKDSVHKLLGDQIIELGLSDYYDVQRDVIKGPHGTEFAFIGLKHNVTEVKSFEGFDVCWVEEAQIVSKGSWEVLQPTIRREGSEIWITFNPGIEDDETFKRYVLKAPANAIVIKMNWSDNPWFPDVLEQERLDCQVRDPDAYLNIWEGHCRQALEGAVYAGELRKAQEDGRITNVKYEPLRPVDTFWDLGRADMCSIWFGQSVGAEWRIIRYIENRQKDITWYIKELQRCEYVYGTAYMPHDAKAKTIATKRSAERIMRDAGFRVKVLPKTNVSVGINAGRLVFANAWFDERLCADGLHALRHYRYEPDEDTKTLSNNPVHDWSSHGADAWRTLGMSINAPKGLDRNPEAEMYGGRGRPHTPRNEARSAWMGR